VPSGAAESPIPRSMADGLATVHAGDDARQPDATRRRSKAAELASAETVGLPGPTWAAPRHPSSSDPSPAPVLVNGQARAKARSLPRGVSWSKRADEDLGAYVMVPAVREYLRRNADKILHDVRPEPPMRCVELWDAGADGELMWHRGVPHEHERLSEQADGLEEQADGPELYFLFYRQRSPGPGFEVVAVRSVHQLARLWACRPNGRLPCGLLL